MELTPAEQEWVDAGIAQMEAEFEAACEMALMWHLEVD